MSTLNQRDLVTSTNATYCEEIKSEVDDLCAVLAKKGMIIHGQSTQGMIKFSSLPTSVRKERLEIFSRYKSLIQAAIEEDIDVKDELELLIHASKRMKLVIPNDILNLVEKDDIVEIYDNRLIQIYRSISFMDLCNYTLADLLSYEYYELYQRDKQVDEELYRVIKQSQDPKELKPISMASVRPHLMREKFSSKRGTFQIQFRYICPVFSWPNERYGFILLQKAKRIAPGSLPDAASVV